MITKERFSEKNCYCLNPGVSRMNFFTIYPFIDVSLQDELYSDFLDLSLSYNVEEGKLTLGIIKCQLAEISSIDTQCKTFNTVQTILLNLAS